MDPPHTELLKKLYQIASTDTLDYPPEAEEQANVCVIFNCIQVLISNVPQTHVFILVLKILL